MKTILNIGAKVISRIFMPGLARSMAEEGQFNFVSKPVDGSAYRPRDYVRVEDNGSDITLIVFAGLAVLYAGMPQFEFRQILRSKGKPFNVIFVRDIRRSCYLEAPDGSNQGLPFYERLLTESLAKLGSSYNVSLGASAGGAGAFYISSRLPIHQIIAFSPGFPQEIYLSARARWHALFNLKQLFREPAAYFEVLLVTLGSQLVWRKVTRIMKGAPVPDVTEAYLGVKPAPPRATVFYGARCAPDREQARRLQHIPSVTTKALPTGRHNCAGFLKSQGKLGQVIAEEIEAGLAAWRVEQDTAAALPDVRI